MVSMPSLWKTENNPLLTHQHQTSVDWEKARTFQSEVRDILDDEFDLLIERQKKYGPGNIEQGGILGCLIRAGDKLERLKRVFPALCITKRYNEDYPDESIEDAMLGLANYATIALMLYRGTWGRPLAVPSTRQVTVEMKPVLPIIPPTLDTSTWRDRLVDDDYREY